MCLFMSGIGETGCMDDGLTLHSSVRNIKEYNACCGTERVRMYLSCMSGGEGGGGGFKARHNSSCYRVMAGASKKGNKKWRMTHKRLKYNPQKRK